MLLALMAPLWLVPCCEAGLRHVAPAIPALNQYAMQVPYWAGPPAAPISRQPGDFPDDAIGGA